MKFTETNNIYQNEHIEEVIDSVTTILAEVKKNLYIADEFETAFNLLTAKTQLSKLLDDITNIAE